MPIEQCSGEPLPPNIPAEAVRPLFLGKTIEDLMLPEARLFLSDFGEASTPMSEVRLGRDCHNPPAFRAPKAKLSQKFH